MAKKKILIVEDEKSLLTFLSEKFRADNFEVYEAVDGEYGLQEALNHHPDIILLDILMPKMDGFEMIHELKKDEWGSEAKIVLLSNLADTEKKVKAEKEGAIAYMVKSELRIDQIVEKVHEILG